MTPDDLYTIRFPRLGNLVPSSFEMDDWAVNARAQAPLVNSSTVPGVTAALDGIGLLWTIARPDHAAGLCRRAQL